MKRRAIIFQQPRLVTVDEEDLPPGEPGQVLVKTELSAISAGTELLFYRGQIPPGLALDTTLPALSADAEFPLRYGYQVVGRIVEAQDEPEEKLIGARVFAFQPHHSHFWVDPSELIFLPQEVKDEDAVFLPNMETAINFLHDGRPLLGERVIVLGQGVVGLLTTALLAAYPLERLITIDGIETRRQISIQLGADASLPPDELEAVAAAVATGSSGQRSDTPDLIYEVSGNPEALNTAIALSGYKTRIILGSWYGLKTAEVDLGGTFHRNRIDIKSSQASTLEPALSGRWTKQRRLATAVDQLRQIMPGRLISHRFPLTQAAQAYQLLDSEPEQALQIIFTYRDLWNL